MLAIILLSFISNHLYCTLVIMPGLGFIGSEIFQEADRIVQVCAFLLEFEFDVNVTLATSDGTGTLCVCSSCSCVYYYDFFPQLLLVLTMWECLWTLIFDLTDNHV